MAKLREVHQFVKYVDEQNERLSYDYFLKGFANGNSQDKITAKQCLEGYAEKYKVNHSHALNILRVAHARRYIDATKVASNSDERLQVTPLKGVDFLDEDKKLNVGLYREILKQNNGILTVTLSVISLIVAIWALFK